MCMVMDGLTCCKFQKDCFFLSLTSSCSISFQSNSILHVQCDLVNYLQGARLSLNQIYVVSLDARIV